MSQTNQTSIKTDLPTQLEKVNPFLLDWDTPFGAPPFDRIQDQHFKPAIEQGMQAFEQEVAVLAANAEAPTFANTIEALERVGALLDKTTSVFYNLSSSDTNETLQALEADLSPKLSKLWNDLYMNDAIFVRIKALHDRRDDLGLTQEQHYLLEQYYKGFVRQGAELNDADKAKLKKLSQALSGLSVQFKQNALAASKAFKLILREEGELAGLPASVRSMGKATAEALDEPDAWVFTLDMGSFEAFMQTSARRDLREQMQRAYVSRNQAGEHANGDILLDILKLRAQQAALLGYNTYADYMLDNRMAKTPAAVFEFLEQIWPLALKRSEEEQTDLQALLEQDHPGETLQPWDWWYYTEQLRAQRFTLDDEAIKPYFELSQVKQGVFYVANRLFGVNMTLRDDLPVYEAGVEAYEVTDANNEHVGIIYLDYFARDSKRQGAWMSEFRTASGIDGVRPIIVNVSNIVPAGPGEPVLLGARDVTTLFHEFGHGLHGLLTQTQYPFFAGTSVLRDFVEFPSQVMERWAYEPEVLAQYAKHVDTGEVIPGDVVEKLNQSLTFNQGFESTEYMIASLLDMHWHGLTESELNQIDSVEAFEQRIFKEYGLPAAIHPRYHSVYFQHITGGYAAGYYVYRWAEVLDADGFMAFKETGDIFNPELAERLKKQVYEKGGSADPMSLYVKFRGKAPTIDALMQLSGLQ